jgi:hypothetical protein
MKKLFLLVVIAAMAVGSAVAQQQKETAPAPAQKEAKPAEQKDAKPAAEQKDVAPATTDQKEKPSADQMKQDRAAWEKKFKEDLKLTAEQSEKYDALSKEYGEKISAIANDASLDKDAQKEKKMGLKKEKEAKFLEILTPEQQTKYKELKESMEKKNAPTKEQ